MIRLPSLRGRVVLAHCLYPHTQHSALLTGVLAGFVVGAMLTGELFVLMGCRP